MSGGQMVPLRPIVHNVLPSSTVEVLELELEGRTRLSLPLETHDAALLNAKRHDAPTVLSYWRRSDPVETPASMCIVPDALVPLLMAFFEVPSCGEL